jgi:hypothetical protein
MGELSSLPTCAPALQVLGVDLDGPRRPSCACNKSVDTVRTARDQFAVWVTGHKAGAAHVSVTVVIKTSVAPAVTLQDSVLITVVPVLTLVSPTVSSAGMLAVKRHVSGWRALGCMRWPVVPVVPVGLLVVCREQASCAPCPVLHVLCSMSCAPCPVLHVGCRLWCQHGGLRLAPGQGLWSSSGPVTTRVLGPASHLPGRCLQADVHGTGRHSGTCGLERGPHGTHCDLGCAALFLLLLLL